MSRLVYKKRAVKKVDHTWDGFIYLHHFGTGWQELVFHSHEAAAAFAVANGCQR